MSPLHRYSVAKSRWRTAHEAELATLEDQESVTRHLYMRKSSWANLIISLKGFIDFCSSTRVLDIGGGSTSVFLGLRQGKKYVVDPNLDHFFQRYPFARELPEYKDVNFISLPIEEAVFDKAFDVIFSINALDHMANLRAVVSKLDELLAPSGTLVLVVDCYADQLVARIIRFFDVDPPHPHHLVAGDIQRLFTGYGLLKRDDSIYHIIDAVPSGGDARDTSISFD